MKSTHRTFRIILLSLTGLLVVLTVGSVIVSKLAIRKLDSRLRAAGITIESLHVNLLNRSVTLQGFEWHDKNASISVEVETVRAAGIDVIAFVRNKEIRVASLVLSKGLFNTDFQRKVKEDSTSNSDAAPQPELPFTLFALGRFQVEDFDIIMKNDSVKEYMAKVAFTVENIELTDAAQFADPWAYSLGNVKVRVDDYQMAMQTSMYTMKVKRLELDSKLKELAIDSVVLLPKYGKYEFSRQLGKQVDRFVLRVPSLTLAGLDFSHMRDSLLIVSGLKIADANLYVFRDKRLPFIKQTHTPLPIALVRRMPIGFAIDSLIIANAKITYEEFPEKGFETGHIVFNRLHARVNQLSNRDYYPDLAHTNLQVTSRVMQNGIIKVDFKLPYDKAQVYNATGRVSNLALEQLNPMLESLAFIRVESGRLNALDFNFDYDDYVSRGTIVINYENLKLAGLKKDEESKKNDLKSLALGLFLRKDKDRAVPLEKRTGKVYYERDRKRAIINVWVKSLFSGIKSSVVDAPAENKTQTRKERRDSLREMRKQEREEKKKDRQEKRDSVQTLSALMERP